MNNIINALSESVLAKPFESNNLIELQEFAEKYPYAAALQLLYTQKLKLSEQPDVESQLQKTLLYFNNPLFIHHTLHEAATTTSVSVEKGGSFSEESEIENEEVVATDNSFPVESEDQVKLEEENIENVEDDAELPPLPAFKIEAIDPNTAPLTFTPYHTIDYFAAQGIKLSEEQYGNDRIGNQLKSFTEWLKQMKRLPGSTIETNITLKEEKNIEHLAEQSINGTNADTEAMADVWAKQGDQKKAIELYQKLSLQNPTKSAYFAAKIEFLKKKS